MYIFQEILKELIAEKSISLRTLSKESGVSAVQYSKYLHGAYPTIDVAIKIANYFNCSLDYLFGVSNVNIFKTYKDYNIKDFVERYKKLLETNNTSHYKFAKTHNLSESCLRHWKYGQIPKIESLIIIAINLSSSIDYLIGRY